LKESYTNASLIVWALLLEQSKLLPKQFYSPNNKRLLSACTFDRPASVYFAKDATTFLPALPQEKMKVSVAPLLMHIVTTRGGDKHNHWATIKLKHSIKLKWPAVDAYHQDVLSTLENPNGIRFWHKNISFKRRE